MCLDVALGLIMISLCVQGCGMRIHEGSAFTSCLLKFGVGAGVVRVRCSCSDFLWGRAGSCVSFDVTRPVRSRLP